jgi:hypothetical protein
MVEQQHKSSQILVLLFMEVFVKRYQTPEANLVLDIFLDTPNGGNMKEREFSP